MAVWGVVALSVVCVAHAFSPAMPVSVLGRGSCAPLQRGVGAAAACRRRPPASASAGAVRLRAADMSLEVSATPPEEDPLADIPAVKMHTAEGV